ncbi:hypothetical protein [Sulfitobacter sp.]|jgi:hypothetical protein|uniref:hypothetical protein n=2 Tax=Sulfitobacter sp. TaxID=1903071 RepID=UPI0039E6F276
MMSEPSSAEAGTFFLAAIALSLATWPVTFTLGTHGEVFFKDVFNIWIASVAALFAGAVVWRTREGETYFTWWGAGLLLVPTLWMASSILMPERSAVLITALTGIMLLGSLPYVGYVLLTVAVPDAMELNHPRLIAGLVVCILLVNTASFLVGKHNDLFMTCRDLAVAGDELPENCWTN